MEIKVGDKVRVSKDAPKVYQKGSVFDYTEHQSTVHELDGDAAIIVLDIEDSPIYSAPIAIPTKYLIKVDGEAKVKSNNTIAIPVDADLTDGFWQAYAADLAKEIAVKIAIPAFDAKDTANYAVSVAKLVVENLKKSAE